MGGMGGMGGFGGFGGGAGLPGMNPAPFAAPAPAPAALTPENRAQYEQRFAAEITQLRDMGFYDVDTNIKALLASGGNVNGAVERLLNS